MERPKLKPCPFCGRDPGFDFVQVDEPVTFFALYYVVYCCRCGVSFREDVYHLELPGQEEEHIKAVRKLAKRWNRRREPHDERTGPDHNGKNR